MIAASFAVLLGGTAAAADPSAPPPAPLSPSCMLNGNASLSSSTDPLPHPCPVPVGWETDWSVVNSTALMSTNPDGFNSSGHVWGWVTLDWQANRKFWLNDDPKKTTCEASSARNCAQLKREGKVRRCTIYHNMELALEWLESSRKVMDQQHIDAGWFLRYPNGSVYDDARQPPAGPLGQPMPWLSQYFIDWRNEEAAAYFVGAIVHATFLPGVDGTFTDDSNGVPAEHPTLAADLGVTNVPSPPPPPARLLARLPPGTRRISSCSSLLPCCRRRKKLLRCPLRGPAARHRRRCWSCSSRRSKPGISSPLRSPRPARPASTVSAARSSAAPTPYGESLLQL